MIVSGWRSCTTSWRGLSLFHADVAHDRNEYAFGNIARSRRVYREVWSRNDGGKVFVDWVDIVEEFDWEIFLV